MDGVPWNAECKDKAHCVLARSQSTVTAADMEFQFDVDKENLLSVFDVGFDFASSGVQSIVQDEVSGIFSFAPSLFCAGTGLVATYHNQSKKPKRPGIAVSNHLSPNDIQIICADVETDRDYLYTVTGQKHTGIIWAIERLVEKLCPSLWFDRANMKDRKDFIDLIMNEGKRAGPVLLFPEGYCTNNTRVLQFRKAVFVDDVIIYPIAIKQDARFGDSFWSEDVFFHYLFRLLSSWASVYDIYYLDAQTKKPDETPDEFASRVQTLIAEAIGTIPAQFDGSVWYKKQEREKYKNALKEKCAKQFSEIVPVLNGSGDAIPNGNRKVKFLTD
uniref:Phospholipid/glycerol acyltransferase domain-containing protein n=1 Tax=Panagrolaimus sp. JU765 TaxID=591449 RepID=A0AC34R9N8_9BILA